MIYDESFCLNDELENTLTEIQRKRTKSPSGEIVCTDNLTIDKKNLYELAQRGMIDIVCDEKNPPIGCFVELTYSGMHYFDEKNVYKKRKRRAEIKDWVRYGITTLIAIAALIVSVISICRK